MLGFAFLDSLLAGLREQNRVRLNSIGPRPNAYGDRWTLELKWRRGRTRHAFIQFENADGELQVWHHQGEKTAAVALEATVRSLDSLNDPSTLDRLSAFFAECGLRWEVARG